jgi:hypothetical protein
LFHSVSYLFCAHSTQFLNISSHYKHTLVFEHEVLDAVAMMVQLFGYGVALCFCNVQINDDLVQMAALYSVQQYSLLKVYKLIRFLQHLILMYSINLLVAYSYTLQNFTECSMQ